MVANHEAETSAVSWVAPYNGNSIQLALNKHAYIYSEPISYLEDQSIPFFYLT